MQCFKALASRLDRELGVAPDPALAAEVGHMVGQVAGQGGYLTPAALTDLPALADEFALALVESLTADHEAEFASEMTEADASTRRCEGDRRISAGARSGLPGTVERLRSTVRRYYSINRNDEVRTARILGATRSDHRALAVRDDDRPADQDARS